MMGLFKLAVSINKIPSEGLKQTSMGKFSDFAAAQFQLIKSLPRD